MKQQRPNPYILTAIIAAACLAGLSLLSSAGSLEPDAPPAPTMRSLNEIYDAVASLNEPASTGSTQRTFLKIEGIDGEATDSNHEKWIEILAFNQGQILVTDGTSNTRTNFQDVVCVKEVDKSTPKLAEAVCKGTVFPKVDIHVTASYTDAGRVTYYACELINVRVVSYNIGSSGQDGCLEDTFSLNFQEIRAIYSEKDDAGNTLGNVEYNWSVEPKP